MTNLAEADKPVVSEQAVDTGAESQVTEQAERQVPLSALEAERQKRQEREEENRYLRELTNQQKAQLEASKNAVQDDGEDLVNKRDLKNFKENLTKSDLAQMKREISEESFKEANPEAIRQINMHLKEILERKPWLTESIERAPNRYSRAYEIVQDFAPARKAQQSAADDAKRIVDNSKKPGSPTTVGKPANMSNKDYLLQMRGTKDFREHRQKLLHGR